MEAERLILSALQRPECGRAWLRAHPCKSLPLSTVETYKSWCVRLLAGEPLAYITGERGFYGLTLKIDARVLDPRPDTETLVDWALDILQNTPSPHVADLGTGSGAIALALQHQRPDARVWAVDSSADALTVARANAQRLNLPIRFVQGSWMLPLATQSQPQKFDLIVSNPPYIAENDSHLKALRYEPSQALTSGPDGLKDIRHIVENAPTHLHNGGWLLLEHGYDQAPAVQSLMQARGFNAVQSRNDLADITRCTGGIWGNLSKEDNADPGVNP